jgi:hypothetical protein
MIMQLNDPRQTARKLLKDSISSNLWLENQQFGTRCRDRLQQHPIAKHPAIQALNQGAFGLDARENQILKSHKTTQTTF